MNEISITKELFQKTSNDFDAFRYFLLSVTLGKTSCYFQAFTYPTRHT